MSFHDLVDTPSDIQNRIISYLGIHPVAKILNEEIDNVCCGVNEYGEYSRGNIVIFEVDEILMFFLCAYNNRLYRRRQSRLKYLKQLEFDIDRYERFTNRQKRKHLIDNIPEFSEFILKNPYKFIKQPLITLI